MSDIHIEHPHPLPLKKARLVATKMAAYMVEEYSLTTEWEGSILRFNTIGVAGELRLEKKRVVVEVTLGFLYKAFKVKMEDNIREALSTHFV
jgi:putative polyhydroxyalkanoate system protein